MDPQVLILVVSFAALLVMNVPVAFALGVCALLTLASLPDTTPSFTVAQRMSTGIASFPLLAIPFFVLAGVLMGEGGMARRLVEFASAVIGARRGGLAYISTATCMMFGAISGSSAAAVSTVGGMMIPEMTRRGYGRPFSVAVVTTAATTGLVIPPSNIMIVYAVVTGSVSVSAMFLAGVAPGVLLGLAIMAACWLTCRTEEHGESEPLPFWSAARRVLGAGARATPSLLLVAIVLGGILGGVFSATEAAAIAVLYAFLLTVVVYREIPPARLAPLVLQAGVTTAVIFLLIGASQAMSWVMAIQNLPQSVSAALLGLSDNPVVLVLLINALLLFVGAFMDMTPAVLIFTPIFLPVATELGMHPVHFGIMLIVNLCIGLCTPPVGACLFIGCSVGKTQIAEVVRPMIPLFAAMIAALVVVAFWADLSLAIPRWMGLVE